MKLLPCPFCGGDVKLTETYARMSPSMGGALRPPQLLSVSVIHHCPRFTDERNNYPVLHHYIEVRGRDHETAAKAWNTRGKG